LSEPKILGTGGGIKNAGKFLKGGPFFVMNADVVIDLDLKKASRRFFDRGNAAALMVLRRIKPREDFARISIDKKGRVRRFGSGRYMFTGVQVLSPVVLGFLKKPSCLIKDGYKKMIKKGLNVYSLIHKGYWNDVGTFERYFEANDSMSCPMLDQGQSEVRI
jgi:NDP-sugar pyrophosphorylase family protein